ncbi:hypothetical protein FACS1894153_1730 [Bacteroidia bacterium]|nr:hypothetical protein FACS1894153_1730 [Bacteroidia bacterium]
MGFGTSHIQYKTPQGFNKSNHWGLNDIGINVFYKITPNLFAVTGFQGRYNSSTLNANNVEIGQKIDNPYTGNQQDNMAFYSTKFNSYQERQDMYSLLIPVGLSYKYTLAENLALCALTGIKFGPSVVQSKVTSNIDYQNSTIDFPYSDNTFTLKDLFDNYGVGLENSGTKKAKGYIFRMDALYTIEAGVKWKIPGDNGNIYCGIYADFGLVNYTSPTKSNIVNLSFDENAASINIATSILNAKNEIFTNPQNIKSKNYIEKANSMVVGMKLSYGLPIEK